MGTTISAGFAGSFAFGGLGANGTDALQHDVGFLAASFTIGSGRAAIFADEAIFLNEPTVAGIAVARLTPTTEDFFLNAFTYVTPSESFAAALDHFLCYEVEGDDVNVTVDLEDQFGLEEQVLVEEPELFCNPVDKNGEGIGDETAHLTGYEIEDESEEVERRVIVTNQFFDEEEQILTVEEPELLFVPSEKDSEPSALNLDHFKYYEAEGLPVNVTVDLEDQFGVEQEVLVGEPELFCNPVAKDVTFPDDLTNPEAHLTCYEIEAEEEFEERDVLVDNQFGVQELEVEEPELLCVPSEKISFETVEDDDDDDDD